MPATDIQGSSAPPSHPSRLFLRLRRDRVHSMDSTHDHATTQEQELEAFQKHVAQKFNELSSVSDHDLISFSWIHNLLNVFLSCQEEFMALLSSNKGHLNKAPMDRLVSEFFERSVKALDVCNAIRDGIEQIRQWQKQLEIVLCALDGQRSLGQGQFRRAKKALIDLAIEMLDEKESNSSITNARNRSFGRTSVSNNKDYKSLGHFRSLSWSVSRSWSAARQLQQIGYNLVSPRPNEVIATSGLAVAVFTMNFVLYFVMWALVAAIPCQDRGLQTPFHVSRHFVWANSILSLHERILEDSKKRERKIASGLLREIYEIEKCARHMNEMIDLMKFPLNEEEEEEARRRVREVRVVYESIAEGLNPLERQVREVFQRIVRSKTEGLNSLGVGKSSTST